MGGCSAMARAVYPAWDEDEAFFDERPARRARKKPLPWFRMLLMSCLIVGGLAYVARQKGDGGQVAARKAVPSTILIAPAPVWTPVASAPALYTIEKASGAPAIEARQHTSGAREDALTFGRFGEARHMRVTFIQGSPESGRSFFVDIVRRAAEAGLAVSRNSLSRVVATKFGPVEAAAMTLVGNREQECQTFRFSERDSGFGFQGWICGADAADMDDAQLACFIDGITLAGVSDPSVKALFVRAEKSRTEACGVASRTASAGVMPPPRP
jgi:hypothetical protein